MTDAEKDAAWRSLPEDYKKEVKEIYEALECDSKYKDGYAQAILMHTLFGKHNLTATEEPIQDKTMNKEELLKSRKERGKQTLNIGDKVRPISASGKPLYDGKVATIIEKGMSGDEVYYGLYIEDVAVEKRSTPLIGKSEIIGNTSLLAPFFAEDLELVKSHAEKEKPRFSKGDRVRYIGENQEFKNSIWRIDGYFFYNDYYKCDMVSSLFNGTNHICNVPLSDLVLYTEEQEPKHQLTNGDKVIILSEPFVGIYGEVADFVFDEGELFVQVVTKIGEKWISPQNLELISLNALNCEKSVENDIPSMSKEDAEELVKCLDELNNSINKFKDSQVDWLAYRMELAKEISSKLIVALSDGGLSSDYCQSVIDETATIVDGIVERLKGGVK